MVHHISPADPVLGHLRGSRSLWVCLRPVRRKSHFRSRRPQPPRSFPTRHGCPLGAVPAHPMSPTLAPGPARAGAVCPLTRALLAVVRIPSAPRRAALTVPEGRGRQRHGPELRSPTKARAPPARDLVSSVPIQEAQRLPPAQLGDPRLRSSLHPSSPTSQPAAPRLWVTAFPPASRSRTEADEAARLRAPPREHAGVRLGAWPQQGGTLTQGAWPRCRGGASEPGRGSGWGGPPGQVASGRDPQ